MNITINKAFLTNCISALLVPIGLYTQESHILSVGLYAFSGGITNWLAVHMLFEKVPLLYGSGVIPHRFQEFKQAIHQLIMRQFFTSENISRFFNSEQQSLLDEQVLDDILDKVDTEKLYQGLVALIMDSPLGAMVSMVGGPEIFTNIKDSFQEKIIGLLKSVVHDTDFVQNLESHPSFLHPEKIQAKVEQVVLQRLEELTPGMVKVIVQNMIKEHLGWLVVWGGVFGGAIGLIVSLLKI